MTRNLWGACYGGGQFVAVGEGGTILTSPDGNAWTARASGTSMWLTSVAYGLGNYIAVGDGGIVIASRDGRTWTPATTWQTSTPTTRLNVVQFNGESFTVYGEHSTSMLVELPARIDSSFVGRDPTAGTWWRGFATALDYNVVGGQTGLAVFANSDPFMVQAMPIATPAGLHNVTGVVFDHDAFVAVGAAGAIVTSRDATNWSTQTSGTTANLNGIAAFNNTLIAIGDSGMILSLDERSTWTSRTSPTTELLLGVAANDTTAIIVGGSGTILRATATPMAPTVATQPASVGETLGGSASFTVRANGSLPLAYQWSRNGQPLTGETRAALARTPLVAGDVGNYTVTITNAAGAVTSAVAALNLLPAPSAIVDSAFHADDSLNGSPSALLALDDGSVLVAGGKPRQIVKLHPDGSIDATWVNALFGNVGDVPFFSPMIAQPDGRILVAGNFSIGNGLVRTDLFRLNRDGTLDATFVPAPEAVVTFIAAMALQPDGRLLIANRGTTPIRLLSDGRLDPDFHPKTIPQVADSTGRLRDWQAQHIAVAADGRIFLVSTVNLSVTSIQHGQVMTSTVQRLDASGAVVSTFSGPQWPGGVAALRALDDGSVMLVETITNAGLFVPANARAVRLSSDGTPFPGYAATNIDSPRIAYIYADGRVVSKSNTLTSPVRLAALGAVDAGFTGGIGEPSLLAATSDGHLLVAGDFTVYNGKPAQHVARLNSVPNDAPNPPRILSFVADKTTVAYGDTVTVRAAVVGSADLTYDWSGVVTNDTLRTASPTLTFKFTSTSQSHRLQLTVRNPRGSATSAPIVFTVLPDALVITLQPTRVSAQTGRDLALHVDANSTSGTTEAVWTYNGQVQAHQGQPWDNGQTFMLSNVTSANAGIYTLTLRNILDATVTTTPIVVTIDDSSRFTNLSTRALVGPGEQTLIAGFSITGYFARTVVIRAAGPALANFGVTGAIPDPQARLIDASTQLEHTGVFSSDGWEAGNADGNQFAIAEFAKVGAFPFAAGSKDNWGRATLSPGNYTVQVTSKSGQTGIALVEIYEDDNDAARMLNVSTRALVRPGTPAISGFAIRGPVAKRVLLRAVGPGLTAFGVTGALTNPRLTLKNTTADTVAADDDWETGANSSDLSTASAAAGAFPLAKGSKDAALLLTLSPGNYTMIVEGGATESGVALIEVYEVP